MISTAPETTVWPRKRLKFCATYNDEVLSEATDDFTQIDYIEISDVSLSGGVEKSTLLLFHEAPSRARRRVRSGDILISTVRTYLKAIAAVATASDSLIASTGFCVVRPAAGLHPSFAGWVAKSDEFVGEVVSRSVGVSYPAINASQLVDLAIPLPPLETQKRVAAFLDEKTAQIDGLMAKKKALLERLAEKRRAIITQAVTKGLNPAAAMKDSGIDWLGQIPTHWEVKRLRFLARLQNGINIGGEYFGSGYPFVSYGDVYSNFAVPTNGSGLVESSDEDRLRYSVRRGDILFTRTSETIEEIGISSTCLQDIDDATFAGFLIRARPWTGTLAPEYSKYYFRQEGIRSYLVKEMNLVTRASLGQTLLGDLPVLLPPVEEQIQIGLQTDTQIGHLDNIRSAIEKSIQALNEYRSALITAAVTGQIAGLQ